MLESTGIARVNETGKVSAESAGGLCMYPALDGLAINSALAAAPETVKRKPLNVCRCHC